MLGKRLDASGVQEKLIEYVNAADKPGSEGREVASFCSLLTKVETEIRYVQEGVELCKKQSEDDAVFKEFIGHYEKIYQDAQALLNNCEKAMRQDRSGQSAQKSFMAYMLGNGDQGRCELNGITKDAGDRVTSAKTKYWDKIKEMRIKSKKKAKANSKTR